MSNSDAIECKLRMYPQQTRRFRLPPGYSAVDEAIARSVTRRIIDGNRDVAGTVFTVSTSAWMWLVHTSSARYLHTKEEPHGSGYRLIALTPCGFVYIEADPELDSTDDVNGVLVEWGKEKLTRDACIERAEYWMNRAEELK